MRILVYGLPLDAVDEYVQIGTSTAREALNHFCSAVIAAFGEEYLRSSNPVDVARLLQEGSCNDINVLQRSPIFSAYIRGESPPVHFTVNGRTYDMGYYLADGIYPDWPAFVKSVRHPMERKTQCFAAVQEGARKDIERAFGVLQARWAVICGPAYG
ncbi:uncharacterized protein LOC120647919 [Panicum virgatum]|uniref:uncharacterized protein LOC120647919 n=1 Tax=Panicum virgatum TaxID=38727 RepID=UPI0019D5F946|nr:uncharacterized protein LOC120647919 [Panicum virgatum]